MAPCMNCLLIEMGEMACYQERCQECGRIPPGRKALPGKKAKPPDVFKKLVGRKLAAKKSATANGDLETHIRTNQLAFTMDHNGTSYPTEQLQQLQQSQQSQQHREQHFTEHDKKYLV